MRKGERTKSAILNQAVSAASRHGIEGLSIGSLADRLEMSKSGLFAHFGSKEDLQIAVLSTAAAKFEEVVVRPALRAPRGAARLRKWFDLWLRWITDPSIPGGCLFWI